MNNNTNTITNTVTNCRLVNFTNNPSLVAFANCMYNGKIYMSDLRIRETKEGEAYIQFPSRKRVKNGKECLDDQGRVIYDDWFGPANAETRRKLTDMIAEAVNASWEGKPLPKRARDEVGLSALNLMKEPKDGFIGFCSGVFDGTFFLTNISVIEPEGKDAFVSYPSRKRVRNGQDVLGDNGKPIYDSYYRPATEEDQEVLQNLIFDAVQAELDKAA